MSQIKKFEQALQEAMSGLMAPGTPCACAIKWHKASDGKNDLLIKLAVGAKKTRIVDSEIPQHLRRTVIWRFQQDEDGYTNLRIGYILLDGTNWIEHLALLMAGNMFGQALQAEIERNQNN